MASKRLLGMRVEERTTLTVDYLVLSGVLLILHCLVSSIPPFKDTKV